MPRVSIIIPCYNAAPWLRETLESALAQTHHETEIIVVDDGSRDDSLAIARGFSDYRVRVVAQPNRGAAAARNHGLQLATGDYVQFLDADDLLESRKIERQLNLLGSATVASICSCPWGRFASDPRSARFVPEHNWQVSNPTEWICHNFAGRGMMPPIAWLTPRRLLDEAGPWNERLSLNDDGEYFTRVLLAADRILFCPDAQAYYRSNLENSLSRRTSLTAWTSALLSHDLCCQHLLARENSVRTRRACADLYQRLAFAIYPDFPELVVKCEAAAQSHGGSDEYPGGGRAFQLLRLTLGWKLARRWQTRASSIRKRMRALGIPSRKGEKTVNQDS